MTGRQIHGKQLKGPCRNSMTMIKALKNKKKISNLFINTLRSRINNLSTDPVFCWIRSHIDITGNDRADLVVRKHLL